VLKRIRRKATQAPSAPMRRIRTGVIGECARARTTITDSGAMANEHRFTGEKDMSISVKPGMEIQIDGRDSWVRVTGVTVDRWGTRLLVVQDFRDGLVFTMTPDRVTACRPGRPRRFTRLA
jgi:hypothetical protein